MFHSVILYYFTQLKPHVIIDTYCICNCTLRTYKFYILNTLPQIYYKCFDDGSMHGKISYTLADKQIPISPPMIL